MKRHIHLVVIWGLVLMAALTGCRSGGANKGGGNGGGSTAPTCFAYVANSNANSISAYGINTTDGGLTPINGSPFSTGDTPPRSLATDPDGKFLYVVDSSKKVLVYSIDPASGAIALIPESPFTTDNIPKKIVVDPTGDFVAVGCSYFLNIFSRDPESGTLTDRQSFTFATDQELGAISFDPTGQYFYVAVSSGWSTGVIYVYAKNPDRTFTQITGSPFTTCRGPWALAFGPKQQFLYVTSNALTEITYHPIASDGMLGTAKGYNIRAQATVSLIQGNFFFTNPAFKKLASLRIGDDGKLTETGSEVTLSSDISSLAVDPTGKYLYASCYSNDIWIISMNIDNGSLTQISTDPFDNGAEPQAIITVQPGI